MTAPQALLRAVSREERCVDRFVHDLAQLVVDLLIPDLPSDIEAEFRVLAELLLESIQFIIRRIGPSAAMMDQFIAVFLAPQCGRIAE